ncbi:SAM-dependent methyltransferase [Alkalitalea saponilacus]|uniref:16S rRNA (Cytidine1402-2'-O)-methyltransferase n=1 Tax=Alkalitalea saponilacus TaxID=889453 RepID=A0A1T5DJ05_9BACT|nr:SAM-dependent methyltransferase [Alkalitalea saponilacus]ASB50710.1 SAM-dependent methyltransferase [Alkalitalea saponilacus]SKB71728.1 16S rRNA (cytidine1402-2'-O)-methyltransferase [Alkalitalea saponilacus]
MPGKLYLIPNTLGTKESTHVIPADVASIAVSLRHFIVEDLRTARRFLRALDREMDIDGSQFYMLNKRTTPAQFAEYLKPLKAGQNVGIISEAGCPGVADPGAEVVKLAHQAGIEVVPMVGPSSILLALMASGMNGQNFAFVGYIPIKKDERIKTIRQLENRSRNEHQSQIFIETPFRNNHLAQDIVSNCNPQTRLCIAYNLTMPDEFVVTKTIGQWKGKLPELHKKPAIFILQG